MTNPRLIIISILATAALLAGLIWWQEMRLANTQPELLLNDDQEALQGPLTPEEQNVTNPGIHNTMNPQAVIHTTKGDITLELYEDLMPITVGNFVSLAESGFYDGTKFHRVIEGFMIQGGDPNSKGANEAIYGTGGPEATIQDEFVTNELLSNVRGTIAMANTGQPNSGGSQWFLNLVDNTGLDFDKPPFTSKHPVFGRIVEGMDVVEQIGSVPTKERDIPIEPIVVEKVTIVRS